MENLKKTHQCKYCNVKFRDNYNLKRHLVSKHNENNLDGFNYKCNYCNREFHQKSNLSSHLKNIHDENNKKFIKCKPIKLNFKTFNEFELWKDNIEKETISKYVKKTRSYYLKDGTKRSLYSCHRSGNFKSRSLGKRKLKIIGSNKINDYCPAKIICLKRIDGNFDILYYSEHKGHEMEPSRINLNKNERLEIYKQIVSKEIKQDLLVNIQSDSNISTTHYLSKKDLYNIRNEFSNKELIVSNNENNMAVNNLINEHNENNVNDIELKTNDEESKEIIIENDIEINYDDLERIKGEMFGDFMKFLSNIENVEQALTARKLISSLPYLVDSLTTNVSNSDDIVISVIPKQENS
ncbi:hypothetical protein O3M35_001670 [Rhynocoris fuscipes]|uniref:C2H2-type domain-containing protein n=1 Tax=Rhynocoris fuscipes TaxID=488301 RepID=A0AAW1CRM7_9HEMI